jgi:hypothetical protein
MTPGSRQGLWWSPVLSDVSEGGKAVVGFHARASRASAIWERVMILAIRSRSLWAAGSDPAAPDEASALRTISGRGRPGTIGDETVDLEKAEVSMEGKRDAVLLKLAQE